MFVRWFFPPCFPNTTNGNVPFAEKKIMTTKRLNKYVEILEKKCNEYMFRSSWLPGNHFMHSLIKCIHTRRLKKPVQFEKLKENGQIWGKVCLWDTLLAIMCQNVTKNNFRTKQIVQNIFCGKAVETMAHDLFVCFPYIENRQTTVKLLLQFLVRHWKTINRWFCLQFRFASQRNIQRVRKYQKFSVGIPQMQN